MPSRSAVLARTDSPLDCPARWVRRRGAKRSKSPKGKLAWWARRAPSLRFTSLPPALDDGTALENLRDALERGGPPSGGRFRLRDAGGGQGALTVLEKRREKERGEERG